MDLLETPLSRALNRLLERESWARERLAPFAGESVELCAPPLPALRLSIAADGTTLRTDLSTPASLVLTVKPGAAAALARGVEHAMREVEVSGNARLASEVLFLVRHLRWDVEESLSHVVGDALAHRVVAEAKGLAGALADSGARIADAFMEFAVEERQLVARRDEHDALAAENALLRDAIERLEKRLDRLGGTARG
jgi:ubiquinone biosynthesis protein UbiJ